MSPRKRSIIYIIKIVVIFLIFLVFAAYFISQNVIFKNFNTENSCVYPQVFMTKDSLKGVIRSLFKDSMSQPAFHGEKLVHIDLKGAPPLVSYLEEFFSYIKTLGATGILIEYEDMFYYKDELEDLRALNAYKPSDIKKIQELAKINNLSVIPLVQTFGHFEFVLKSEKYKNLREIKNYPQMLCPSQDNAVILVKKMIDQVLEAHPDIKYIHLGCDEVMYLGECNKCRLKMKENYWTTAQLFLNHVKTIASYINETYPGVRPIIWDDMIRKFNERLIGNSKISNFVDLMVWKYIPDVPEDIKEETLNMYSNHFNSIWIASAFKGATGAHQIFPDPNHHLANHISWLKIVNKWKNCTNFKGIALTGWQRYDHFAELCELIPAAIPSLTACLHYLRSPENGVDEEEIFKYFQCDSTVKFSPLNFQYSDNVGICRFPGYSVFMLINKFYDFISRNFNHVSFLSRGWFSVYNIVHKFSNKDVVKRMFGNWPLELYRAELMILEVELRKELLKIYDEFTVEEWMTTYVTPFRLRLEAFHVAKNAILEQKVWPNRPFMNETNNLRRTADEICSSENVLGCALILI